MKDFHLVLPIHGIAIVLLVLLTAGPANGSLVVNGDFQSGNTGFYTDFTYSPGDLVPEYIYDVIADPSTAHFLAESFYDHTYGTSAGLMMAINGRSSAGDPYIAWGQTITVQPDQDYDISIWHTIWIDGPSLIQVQVNGVPFGSEFQAGILGSPGVWVEFDTTWNSGDATTADLEVLNITAVPGGNDFALDDIYFATPVALDRNTWAGIKSVWE